MASLALMNTSMNVWEAAGTISDLSDRDRIAIRTVLNAFLAVQDAAHLRDMLRFDVSQLNLYI